MKFESCEWEGSLLLCVAHALSHTVQDWRVADKRGYDLNHVFTDSYSQLFPEEKGSMLPMLLCTLQN